MNIYTHPIEIKNIASKLNNNNLVAWNIGNDYHMLNGLIYAIWHSGTGNFPELVDSIPDNACYITCAVS